MTKPVAWITGGARGIGLGIAEALCADFDLVISGRRARSAPSVCAAMKRLAECGGGRAEYLRCDIADISRREKALDKITRQFGTAPTAFISNAGVAPARRTDLLKMTPESFDRVLGINLRGAFFYAQAAARRMTRRRPVGGRRPGGGRRCGAIVFITSVSAEMASPSRGEYCIAKAGCAMARALFAARLAGEGIGVYEIRPGIIQTDMTAGVRGRYDALLKAGLVPAGRWGTPADIGGAVRRLLGGDFDFADGAVIHIDGGLSLSRL